MQRLGGRVTSLLLSCAREEDGPEEKGSCDGGCGIRELVIGLERGCVRRLHSS